MDYKDIKQMLGKIEVWNKLDERDKNLSEALRKLDSITGDFSQVRVITLTISPQGKEPLIIEHSGLTDYEIKCAIYGLIRKNREDVWKAKKEL